MMHPNPDHTLTRHATPRIRPWFRPRVLATMAAMVLCAAPTLAQPFSMSLDRKDTRWRVVVDGVMGGLSSGRVEHSDSGLRFSGDLRLENNGGFSQIRTPIGRGSLEGADGIEIEVRGDGRTYIFDARVANLRMDAGSYQHEFDTVEGAWTTVRMPFAAFRYHAFGRLVPGLGAMRPAMIESLGVTLADKNAGGFELEIRAIRGYAEDDERDRRLAKLRARLGVGDDAGADDRGRAAERDARLAGLADLLAQRAQPQGARPAPDRDGVSVGFADDLVGLCVLAIERGVPLFNDGQPAACAAVYELTLASIVQLGGDELDDRTLGMLHRTLRDGQRIRDAGERAWHYRRTLDALIQSFSGHA